MVLLLDRMNRYETARRALRCPATLRALSSRPTTQCESERGRFRGSVVLVHGFRVLSQDREESSLNTLDSALRQRGYATHRFAYRSKDDTVQGHATALAKFMLSAIDAERQQQQFTCSERTETQSRLVFGLVSHSFGGLLIRAALNTSLWNNAWSQHMEGAHIGRQVRCVMIAPPNQGSALARALLPTSSSATYPQHSHSASLSVKSVSNFDRYLWSAAVDYMSNMLLGTKAGLELASVDNESCTRVFGTLPPYAHALVIAGDCGRGNPLLDGPNDGVVTVAETMLDTQHTHLTLLAPHNLIADHPAGVRAVLAFLSAHDVPGAQRVTSRLGKEKEKET